MPHHVQRRAFLQSAGLAAGAMVLTNPGCARGYPANEAIQIACIGTGGRCRTLLQRIPQIEGVRVTALADVFDAHREKVRELVEATEVFQTRNYPEVLKRKDVDAVMIVSPDHWHVPMTIDAVAAGKDVYVEKPLTHNFTEGAKVIAAVKKSDRIVQVGTQQRSMPQFIKVLELIREGKLGKVHRVNLYWNRNTKKWSNATEGIEAAGVDWKGFLGSAPDQPFSAFKLRNWRWFWDFGGGVFTDLMVHFLDVAYWYFDLKAPDAASAIGDRFLPDDPWETPDTVQVLYRYPDKQLQVHFEGGFSNARRAGSMELMGTEASVYLDRGRYELYPERRSETEASSMILGTGTLGASGYKEVDGVLMHLQNWVDCMRTRKQPNAPVEQAVAVSDAAHLANQSLRAGETKRWPPK